MKENIPIRIALILLLAFSLCDSAKAQDAVIVENRIKWSRDFIAELYPALSNKQFLFTVQMTSPLDQQPLDLRTIRFDVGLGAKDEILETISGCMTVIPSTKQSYSSDQTYGTRQEQTLTSSGVTSDCAVGPKHPEQFLTSTFRFDIAGHLVSFGASGQEINDGKVDEKIRKFIDLHPGLSDIEILQTMKQFGINFTADDTQKFVRDLPKDRLGSFLGLMTEITAKPPKIRRENGIVFWDRLWVVTTRCTRKDGSNAKYEIAFDYSKGRLASILLITDGK